VSGESHNFPNAVIFVVAVLESDEAIGNRDDTIIGDSDSVSVASKVFDDGRSGLERRFTVDNPIEVVGRFDEVGEITLVVKIKIVVEERQIERLEMMEEFTTEEARENPNGYEKLFLRVTPFAAG